MKRKYVSTGNSTETMSSVPIDPRKKTINGWEEIFKITILDPDGFDRTDPKLYERLFTRDEFLEGASGSTMFLKFWGVLRNERKV